MPSSNFLGNCSVLKEEGLFRVSGNLTTITMLNDRFKQGMSVLFNVCVVGGCWAFDVACVCVCVCVVYCVVCSCVFFVSSLTSHGLNDNFVTN